MMESESPVAANAEKKGGGGRMTCLDAGLCLCDDRGRSVEKIRKGLCVFLSKAYPTGPDRTPMYDGFAVLQLRKTRPLGLLRSADVNCPGVSTCS